MKILIGDLIENRLIVKTSAVPYSSVEDFFVALVTICDNLNVDIPIWTLKEDQLLNKGNEVILALKDSRVLRIFEDNRRDFEV